MRREMCWGKKLAGCRGAGVPGVTPTARMVIISPLMLPPLHSAYSLTPPKTSRSQSSSAFATPKPLEAHPGSEGCQNCSFVQVVLQRSPFPSPRMIPDRSSPSRVRFAASRPGPLRADPKGMSVYEGKGGLRFGPGLPGPKEPFGHTSALSRSVEAESPAGP